MSIDKVLQNLVENNIDIEENKDFSAIIGFNPSKGARSPKLWNYTYEKLGIKTRMLPLDVRENNLKPLLEYLSNNDCFIGGSIAVPYKVSIANLLKETLTKSSKEIGAVNCLFRENNIMRATNTDGEGSVLALKQIIKELSGKTIMILGNGGTAMAAKAYFKNEVGYTGKIINASRSFIDSNFINNILEINWSEIPKYISISDIIINATTIGYDDQQGISPISDSQFNLVNKSCIIYDVIYQPLETELIKLSKKYGISNINGIRMNLEQAVLGFYYANKEKYDYLSKEDIYNHMQKAY